MCNELIKSGVLLKFGPFSLLYPSFLFPGKPNIVMRDMFKILKKKVINTMNPFNWIKVSKKMANNTMPESIILRYWSPILVFPYFFIRFFFKQENKSNWAY